MAPHNVIVIGDKCTDKYVYGECKRISPEQPVPVLDKTETKERPGMAANTELNLKAFGINTVLLSQREQITKTRFVDSNSGYQLLRLDETPEVSRIANAELTMDQLVSDLLWMEKGGDEARAARRVPLMAASP